MRTSLATGQACRETPASARVIVKAVRGSVGRGLHVLVSSVAGIEIEPPLAEALGGEGEQSPGMLLDYACGHFTRLRISADERRADNGGSARDQAIDCLHVKSSEEGAEIACRITLYDAVSIDHVGSVVAQDYLIGAEVTVEETGQQRQARKAAAQISRDALRSLGEFREEPRQRTRLLVELAQFRGAVQPSRRRAPLAMKPRQLCTSPAEVGFVEAPGFGTERTRPTQSITTLRCSGAAARSLAPPQASACRAPVRAAAKLRSV